MAKSKKRFADGGIAQLYRRWVNKKAVVRVLERPSRGRRPASIGIEVAVICVDARMSYGNAHILVRPAHGSGSAWVELTKLKLVDEWPEPYEAQTTAPVAPDGLGERGVGSSAKSVSQAD